MTRSKPRKKQFPTASFEYTIFILFLIVAVIGLKILADFYILFTDKNYDEPIVQDPIGFYKCPKNKKSEGLYCPIYPQRKN